jgi:hypothetical protein
LHLSQKVQFLEKVQEEFGCQTLLVMEVKPLCLSVGKYIPRIIAPMEMMQAYYVTMLQVVSVNAHVAFITRFNCSIWYLLD